MSQFIIRTLDNGLRVCLEPLDHVPSAACGFLAQTGARDESAEEEGISHFLEHMCFKGTPNRDWQEINQGFDRLGSNYNAFTSEEQTMYYGWVPAENLNAQTEILADMMRSHFPKEEFDTEKKVVLEEIAMYKDNLARSMFDLATQELFKGSKLSHSVLGTEETLQPMTREHMADYHARRYGSDNLVYIATGRMDTDDVLRNVEKHTKNWKPSSGGRDQPAPELKRGIAKQQKEKFNQQALMLCYPSAPGKADDTRVSVLSSILAGDNSRFFWEIVQKGICPHAGAFHLDYSDTGVFILYSLCEPERAETVITAMKSEAEKLTKEGPTAFELTRVKNNSRTALAHAGDSPMSRLLQISDDVDTFGEPKTLEQHLANIDKVTGDDVSSALAQYPITGDSMLVSVGPADWPT